MDGDGIAYPDDCDEANADVHPGADELCNGVDDDCDGVLPAEEQDGDEDGVAACDGDCDDADAEIGPFHTEVCGNGRDDDCVPDPTACRWEEGSTLVPTVTYAGTDATFGFSLAAGDYDGDGTVDLAVGAPLGVDVSNDGVRTGSVHLFAGPLLDANHVQTDAFATVHGPIDNCYAGYSVANGGGPDTRDVVVTGMPAYNTGYQVGAVGVPEGVPSGDVPFAPLFIGLQHLGHSVARLDDLDGNGLARVVAADHTQIVFFTPELGTADLPVRMNLACGDWSVVANAGDLDGDGVVDVAVGQPNCGAGPTGVVYVVDGASIGDGLPVEENALTMAVGSVQYGGLGFDLVGGTDVTGDGHHDLAVTALQGGPPFSDGYTTYETGTTWVIGGGPALPSQVGEADLAARIDGPAVPYSPLVSVETRVDLEGDGQFDVLVGSPMQDLPDNADAGQLALFYGPVSGVIPWDSADAYVSGVYYERVGWSIEALGDVDGDGAGDFAVGSYGFETASSVTLFRGRGE